MATTIFDPFQGFGPLGTGDPAQAPALFTRTVSTIIGVTTVSAGLWFLLQIFTAAFNWLTSGGEKQQLENAKKRFTNSIIGLFLVVISYALVALVGAVLGLPILDLTNQINDLVPN